MKYKFKILILCVSVSALTNCTINRNATTTTKQQEDIEEDVVVEAKKEELIYKNKNVWLYQNLIGKVKSIQVLPYEAVENSGKIEKGERHNMITNTVETFRLKGSNYFLITLKVCFVLSLFLF